MTAARRNSILALAILLVLVVIKVATLGGGAPSPSTASYSTTASAGALSPARVVQLWEQAGGSPATASTALCIAEHESALRPDAESPNPDGGENIGLFQLDTPGGVGAGYSVAQLEDPATNARVAVKGSGNGTNWDDWATKHFCV